MDLNSDRWLQSLNNQEKIIRDKELRAELLCNIVPPSGKRMQDNLMWMKKRFEICSKDVVLKIIIQAK